MSVKANGLFVKWKCFIYFQFWQSHIWVIQNIWNIMMSNNVSWMQIGCLFNVNVNAWFVQQQRASSYPCKGATKSQTGESHDVFLLFFSNEVSESMLWAKNIMKSRNENNNKDSNNSQSSVLYKWTFRANNFNLIFYYLSSLTSTEFLGWRKST